ncbi:DUF4158 domain-containing protein [Nonomuraea sp. NPDC005692]|uniref:DUF4158 domain-containing protein n=1 Tax=Nonomuraea sp. NPDC005692 TaxID=3157168 RepID=UPI0034059119
MSDSPADVAEATPELRHPHAGFARMLPADPAHQPGPVVGVDRCEGLVDHWTVLSDEADLVNAKHENTRLPFALLLKYYTQHGRLPRGRSDFPDEVVTHVARQTKTSPGSVGLYDWSGRTIERHRGEIRDHLGFRECSVADASVRAWPGRRSAGCVTGRAGPESRPAWRTRSLPCRRR